MAVRGDVLWGIWQLERSKKVASLPHAGLDMGLHGCEAAGGIGRKVLEKRPEMNSSM